MGVAPAAELGVGADGQVLVGVGLGAGVLPDELAVAEEPGDRERRWSSRGGPAPRRDAAVRPGLDPHGDVGRVPLDPHLGVQDLGGTPLSRSNGRDNPRARLPGQQSRAQPQLEEVAEDLRGQRPERVVREHPVHARDRVQVVRIEPAVGGDDAPGARERADDPADQLSG